MDPSTESPKEIATEVSDSDTRPAAELQIEQPEAVKVTDNDPGVTTNDQENIINQPEPVSDPNYLTTDSSSVVDDRAILTDNRSPSPISPEYGTLESEGSIKQNPHKELALTVSQGSHVSIPMSGAQRSVKRTASVTTRGGRVIRNIKENNSVKYNIGSAFGKHPEDFSNYKNIFRPGSIKKEEQEIYRPSLRRDGQKRRTSAKERLDSERSSSVSSDGMNSKLSHQGSVDSCNSTGSNTQLVSNPYNEINHKISSFVWCPCFFFFCFGCSLPAFQFMRYSDSAFDDADYDKARTYARISTVLYILGMILSVAFWAGIFAVILIFAV